MSSKALIYIEISQNKIQNVSKEIISKAIENLNGTEVSALIIASNEQYTNLKDELELLPVKQIFVIKDDLFETYNTCIFSKVLSRFLNDIQPDIFLMGATDNGRDLAPRTASALNIGLTADCTDISCDSEGNLLATRPTYGGQLKATIISKTKPNFATIRPGAFKINNLLKSDLKPQFIEVNPQINGLECLIEILNCEYKEQPEDWTCSEIIVSGGMGLKTKENFDLIYRLSDLLGAKPAASRAAVEQGWAPQTIQIGQTGVSVSPKLYLAFGISGAMQHMTGITNADRIIAINTDRNAPIMKASDVAINADAIAVIKSLIESYSSI